MLWEPVCRLFRAMLREHGILSPTKTSTTKTITTLRLITEQLMMNIWKPFRVKLYQTLAATYRPLSMRKLNAVILMIPSSEEKPTHSLGCPLTQVKNIWWTLENLRWINSLRCLSKGLTTRSPEMTVIKSIASTHATVRLTRVIAPNASLLRSFKNRETSLLIQNTLWFAVPAASQPRHGQNQPQWHMKNSGNYSLLNRMPHCE